MMKWDPTTSVVLENKPIPIILHYCFLSSASGFFSRVKLRYVDEYDLGFW